MSARPLVAGRDARSWLRVGATAAYVAILSSVIGGPAPAAAQLISIKTVPVAEGDQFAFFPSANLGMAGVSIALHDTLLDPFGNPAAASRIRRTHFFGAPSFYSVSSDAGSGRTFPVGAFAQRGSSFAGVVLALQEVSGARTDEFGPFFGPEPSPSSLAAAPTFPNTPRTRTNQYALAMLGRVIPEAKLSLAASAFWSGLNAVDGVDLLYPGSQDVKQFGQAVDFRLGLLKELAGDQSIEAVIVHNRFAMGHDVTYMDFFWDPTLRTTVPTPRLEQNPDRTNTWGLHLQYQRPLADSGRRLGAIVTANRMSHPKIPNYEIMSIPRDPGYSSAFNVGVGLSETNGPVTLALDLVAEPIWSHTWADAEEPIQTSDGGTIPAGAKTIENRFRFANALLRAGVSRDFKLDMPGTTARMQGGIQIRSIGYHLDQYSHVVGAGRTQDERWIEWTYTWGTSVRMPELEVHYRLRMMSGTGRPGVAGNGFVTAELASSSGRAFLLAPSGALTLDPVRVTTHQIAVSFPLR
jgi:hypothetical protein